MSTAVGLRPKIVLLVENLVDRLDKQAELLEQGGYRVIKAATVRQAERAIRTQWVHLGVFDTRMADEKNELDFSGAQLALSQELDGYPRIIFTDYFEHTAIELINRYLGELPPGVRVRSKRQHDIVEIVDDAFRLPGGMVKINFEQDIVYAPGLSRFSLAEALRDEPLDDDTFLLRAREIEDLFSKAFVDAQRLHLAMPRQGQSGSVIVLVTPERDNELRAPFIVKCGARQTIRRERRNYHEHVQDFIPEQAPSIDGEHAIETKHFGLIKYRIVGGNVDLQRALTFAEFYDEHDPAPVIKAITWLFKHLERGWYGKPQPSTNKRQLPALQSRFYEDRLLFPIRSPSIDRVKAWEAVGVAVRQAIDLAMSTLDVIRLDGATLRWRVRGQTLDLPDPFVFLSRLREGPSTLFPAEYAISRCHGDLHAENILVDEQSRSWVIDFEYSGWGPLLQDAVELESVVRFRLLSERHLERLLLLEHALATQSAFDQAPPLPEILRGPDARELEKAYQVSLAIRSEAGKIAEARLPDYFLGLLYHALRILLNRYPSTQPDLYMRRSQRYQLQALFSASLYCQRLDPAPQSAVLAGGFV